MERLLALTNYVYDDDNTSGDYSKSETVCAPKSSETKGDAATPRIIGSLKQDHWILDRKNKQLIRVHITPVHTNWSEEMPNQS